MSNPIAVNTSDVLTTAIRTMRPHRLRRGIGIADMPVVLSFNGLWRTISEEVSRVRNRALHLRRGHGGGRGQVY